MKRLFLTAFALMAFACVKPDTPDTPVKPDPEPEPEAPEINASVSFQSDSLTFFSINLKGRIVDLTEGDNGFDIVPALYFSKGVSAAGDLVAEVQPIVPTLNDDGSFEVRVSGLLPDTEYSSILIACISDKEFSSDILHFTTLKDPHQGVDLGLSVLWAETNLGGEKPEDYGAYYSWAGLEDVTSKDIWLDWSHCPDHEGETYSSGWIKYVPDGKTRLDPEDDAASSQWRGGWSIPTDAQWQELIDKCDWQWEVSGTTKGYRVTSTVDGYTDRSIFLPAAGYRDFDFLSGAGTYGCYWSSSLCVTYPYYAWRMYFKSTSRKVEYKDRSYGQPIRAVASYSAPMILLYQEGK